MNASHPVAFALGVAVLAIAAMVTGVTLSGAAAGAVASTLVLVAALLGLRAASRPPQLAPRPAPGPSEPLPYVAPLFASLAEGVLLLDAEMTVLTANRSGQEILGRGLEELASLSLIRAVRDAGIVQIAREATGIPREVETAQGHRLRVTASTLALGSLRTLLVIEDLTELRRAERARADLVANVSHELRTPLSAVRALAETLEDGVDDPQQRSRFLGLMLTEIDRMTAMVERLLHLSRLEAGTVGFAIESLDAEDLAMAAVERIAPIAQRSGVTIATDLADTPGVRGDRERVLEVLANLLENASRFSPKDGTVVLRTLSDVDAVRFEVQDEGPGVLPTDRDRVFERFFTGDQARTQGGAGSGLGLAIARHTVRQLGGRIWVADATPGATFCFTLPVAVDDGPLTATEPSPP